MAGISARAVKELRDQTGAGMMDCKRVLVDAGGDVKRAVELLRERGLAKAGKREGRATSEGAIAIAFEGAAGGMVELGCETDFVARTEPFGQLAEALARAVVGDPGLATEEALLGAALDGEKVADRVNAAIAQLGENVVVKRVARIAAEGDGFVGGYVHAGGKLGVLVALATAGRGEAYDALARDLAMHVAAHDPTPLAVDRDGVPAEVLEGERAIYRRQAEQSGKPAKVLDRIVDGKIAKYLSEVCLLEQGFVKDPDRTIADLLREVGGQGGSEVAVAAFVRFKLGEAVDS